LDGLLGHWLAGGDKGADGNAASDLSPAHRHGRIAGARRERDAGAAVMLFDGKESRVEVMHHGSLALSKDLSILAWVRKIKSNNFTRWDALLTKGPMTYDYEFLVSKARSDELAFYSPNCTPNEVYSGERLTIERWQHAAVTVSGDTVTFYLDGMPVKAEKMEGIYPSSDSPLLIGYDGHPDNGFHGAMHDMMIYGRALDASDVRAVWQQQKEAYHADYSA
jgi:hypothetical protein